MLDWCRRERIECLYFLADADDSSTQALLADAGFEHVDDRVTFERSLTPDDESLLSDTRAAREADIPALREIARTAHIDTRFYADPHFARDRCDELYSTWIENSCRGGADHVLVAERDGRVVGYVALQGSGDIGQIGLIGVHAGHRHRGIGGDLVRGSLRWFAERSKAVVKVVTQGRNIPSQALYASAGFHVVSTAVWYHRWFDERKGQHNQ